MSEKLNENISDWFWEIVQNAEKSNVKLRSLLMLMSKEEVYRFQDEFLEAASELKDDPFFDYMIDSEDGAEDVANWVVSQGKEYYMSVIDNPETIPYKVDESNSSILSGVAPQVYEERFGEMIGIY